MARVGEGLAFFVRVEGFDASDTHRSVYLPVVRDRVLESLALFDFADPSLVTGERATTTGPAQALYFLNGPLVIRQAEALADRVRAIRGRRGRSSRSWPIGSSSRGRRRASSGTAPWPSSANSRHARQVVIRHAGPGVRSARLFWPAASSAIGID